MIAVNTTTIIISRTEEAIKETTKITKGKKATAQTQKPIPIVTAKIATQITTTTQKTQMKRKPKTTKKAEITLKIPFQIIIITKKNFMRRAKITIILLIMKTTETEKTLTI